MTNLKLTEEEIIECLHRAAARFDSGEGPIRQILIGREVESAVLRKVADVMDTFPSADAPKSSWGVLHRMIRSAAEEGNK